MRTVCKCHGMSGSCTVKTCWRMLPLFSEVGLKLKEKFDGASKVIATNDGKGFIPEGASIKVPGKEDLVYSEESPDFCEANKATGSLGTKGRECNATSKGVDGCELLCCGRGYQTIQISEKIKNGQVSEHFIFSTFFPCSKLMSFSFFSLFIFLLLTSLTVDL